jgi:uncharacterized RDD family membrane protein YckC
LKSNLANVYLFARIKSFIIDLFMIYTPIIYIITYLIVGSQENFQNNPVAQFSAVMLFVVINSILISINAQTIGLKAYDLYVLNNDDSKISFIKAVGRFYIFLILSASFIGLLIPLFRKDKKMLHDIISKTKVIYKV